MRPFQIIDRRNPFIAPLEVLRRRPYVKAVLRLPRNRALVVGRLKL